MTKLLSKEPSKRPSAKMLFATFGSKKEMKSVSPQHRRETTFWDVALVRIALAAMITMTMASVDALVINTIMFMEAIWR